MGHAHRDLDASVLRSRACIHAVSLTLGMLLVTAGVQVAIYALSGSVALLVDLIHNFGDALTALPIGIAFFLRSARGERIAGLGVVLAIFVSACVALAVTIDRLVHRQPPSHLWVLAAAGVVGFAGNEAAAVGCGCAQGAGCPARRSSPTATTPGSTASSASVLSPAPSS